jgi:hypothetical protein
MRSPSAVEDQAFLEAEARELAMLAEESVADDAVRRKPASILHTLSVELSVLMGLGDGPRTDWLVAEASRLLSDRGKPEALRALQDTLSRMRRPSGPAQTP